MVGWHVEIVFINYSQMFILNQKKNLWNSYEDNISNSWNINNLNTQMHT